MKTTISNPFGPLFANELPTNFLTIGVAVWAVGFICMIATRANAETTQWVQIQTDPANTPPGRESAAMVYDEKREVILMHGGRDAPGQPFSDTWEWNGRTWRLVAANGPAISMHGMAYDASRDRTVLYGGRKGSAGVTNGINEGETWEWDGASWSEIETGSAEPLVLFTMVYDRERGKIIRHGGVANHAFTSSDPATYEWDGTNWTQIAEGSFIRGGQRATYDSERGRTVVFGGASRTDIPRPPITDGGTWEFVGNEWMNVANTGPSARVFHGLVFDEYRKVSLLYGGTTLSTHFNDTWEWDGVRWTEVDIPGPAGNQAFITMGYDPKRRKAVIFGGSPGVHNGFLDSTWEYSSIPEPSSLVLGAMASVGLMLRRRKRNT